MPFLGQFQYNMHVTYKQSLFFAAETHTHMQKAKLRRNVHVLCARESAINVTNRRCVCILQLIPPARWKYRNVSIEKRTAEKFPCQMIDLAKRNGNRYVCFFFFRVQGGKAQLAAFGQIPLRRFSVFLFPQCCACMGKVGKEEKKTPFLQFVCFAHHTRPNLVWWNTKPNEHRRQNALEFQKNFFSFRLRGKPLNAKIKVSHNDLPKNLMKWIISKCVINYFNTIHATA